ncbi:hypothetical protein ACQRBF_06900 [Peptoniphilaceae bacterium SGI.131]
MKVIKDALNVNKLAFTRSLKAFKYLPILTVIIVLFAVVQLNVSFLLYRLISIVYIRGIILYVMNMAFLSCILSVVFSIITYGRIRAKDFHEGFVMFLSPLLNTYFFIYLIETLISIAFSNIENIGFISRIIAIIILAVKSPLNEKVYIGSEQGIQAIGDSITFIKDNIVPWAPIAIIFVFFEFQFNLYVTIAFNMELLVNSIAYGFIMAFVYIYKGELFKILNNSSVRKREFQGLF